MHASDASEPCLSETARNVQPALTQRDFLIALFIVSVVSFSIVIIVLYIQPCRHTFAMCSTDVSVGNPETSLFNQPTLRNTPEDGRIHFCSTLRSVHFSAS